MTSEAIEVPEMERRALRVRGLAVTYQTPRGPMTAVEDVTFDLAYRQTLGIVGESGCGKSSLARAILQLPRPSEGEVYFEDVDLTTLSGRRLRAVRPKLQMVFQEPISSLNPRHTIRQSVGEPLRLAGVGGAEANRRIDEMLGNVGLEPKTHGDARPAQLSGGQCQRAAIARALLSGARVLVCDEAVSALDVSLRATVLNVIMELQRELGFAVLFIGHDLAVVKNVSDRVMVMYLGKVAELGPSDALYEAPLHPYTAALLAVVPEPDARAALPGAILAGEIPSPRNPPSGCRFRTRCPFAQERCAQEVPALREVLPGREVACHFPLNVSPVGGPVTSASQTASEGE